MVFSISTDAGFQPSTVSSLLAASASWIIRLIIPTSSTRWIKAPSNLSTSSRSSRFLCCKLLASSRRDLAGKSLGVKNLNLTISSKYIQIPCSSKSRSPQGFQKIKQLALGGVCFWVCTCSICFSASHPLVQSPYKYGNKNTWPTVPETITEVHTWTVLETTAVVLWLLGGKYAYVWLCLATFKHPL